MRKRYLWLIAVAVFLLVAALVLVSCGSSSTTTTAATAGPTTTSGGSTTTAAGAIDAAALYTQDCAGCHKSLPGGSADDVKAAIESGKGDMPSLSDKLSAAQIAALAAWVANGGK
jgi:mono/diheme cytochrome c family protein